MRAAKGQRETGKGRNQEELKVKSGQVIAVSEKNLC